MVCKKCGANIADTSKFCGYCGNQIEQLKSVELPVQNIDQNPAKVIENQPSVENIQNRKITDKMIVFGIVLIVISLIFFLLAFNNYI